MLQKLITGRDCKCGGNAKEDVPNSRENEPHIHKLYTKNSI